MWLNILLDYSIANTDSPCKLRLHESEYTLDLNETCDNELYCSPMAIIVWWQYPQYKSENSFEYVWIDLQDCWKDRRAAGCPVGSTGTGPATIPDENLIPTWIATSLLRLYHRIRGVRSQLRMCTSPYLRANQHPFFSSRLKQIAFDSFCDHGLQLSRTHLH